MTTGEDISAVGSGASGAHSQEAPVFPFKRTCPFEPAAGYAEGDGIRRVTFKNVPAWLVTEHRDVKSVLADRRSSVQNIPDPSRGDSGSEALPGFFVAMDPPEQTRLRKMLSREFTPRRMEAMRPIVERIANKLIDEMLAQSGPADLVDAIALPLPSLVICELLGVPYDKHDWFQVETRKVLDSDATPEEVGGAIAAVMQYLGELTASKMENPGDDLISLLLNHVRGGDLTVTEVAGMATLLLMAGHETTGNMISLGVFALLEHPDQLEQLRQDPSLLPGAVEELLRYLDIIGNLPRTLTADMEIGGQTLAEGDLVMVATDAANRDEAVFNEANALDIRRDARGHIAFGYGIHTCLGAPLARVELQVVIGLLLERVPNLKVAVPAEEIEVKSDAKIFGLKSLPLTW
ncbi:MULTISPECIES: cytochrome P450 [Mycobacterium avium complex (MAC)]|uniref:Cytochrome P450 n=1 Tax=Mycobacterium arosiense ATCC BAA-1401 = DSM 45069 TaxID=1265311 RepID=A0A1W9ZHX3_MYCAI|nr:MULTISPECIES: cytochrome P450 [Mycobacterium avium complex (MAC)]ORA15693.1 cytochrome P450 [Mycobacterium arosiense ATCC BAA-1401 = DSM 45069]